MVGGVGSNLGRALVSDDDHDILLVLRGQVHAFVDEAALLVVEVVALLGLALLGPCLLLARYQGVAGTCLARGLDGLEDLHSSFEFKIINNPTNLELIECHPLLHLKSAKIRF